MKRLLPILSVVLTALLFTACRSDIVYSRFQSVSHPGGMNPASDKWHMDSVVSFTYEIADASADYRMIVYVRHTERYPYQNMWLFVGDSLMRDTIEFYLADDRGIWLGNKHNGFMEMPVLLEEAKHFPDTGTYCLTIQHAMRDSLLRGVTDIGLEIIRHGEE